MTTIERIELLLKERGISAAQMSKACGLSSGLFSQWKSGTQAPSLKKLTAIAEFFGVTTDYLLGKEKEKAAPVITTRSGLYDKLSALSDSEFDELENYVRFIYFKRNQKA